MWVLLAARRTWLSNADLWLIILRLVQEAKSMIVFLLFILCLMLSAFMKTAFQHFFNHPNGKDLAFESLGDTSVLTLISPHSTKSDVWSPTYSCTAVQLHNLSTWCWRKFSKLSTLCNQHNIVNIRFSSLCKPILSDSTAADWQKETILCYYSLNEAFWAWKLLCKKESLMALLGQGSSLNIAPCDTVITKIWLDEVVLMS